MTQNKIIKNIMPISIKSIKVSVDEQKRYMIDGFDKVFKQIDSVDDNLIKKIDSINFKIDDLGTKIDRLTDQVGTTHSNYVTLRDFSHINDRVKKIEHKIVTGKV